MRKNKYTFITGMGRSGTKFLSQLLQLDSNYMVKHEEIGNREFLLASWYIGQAYTTPYLKGEKQRIDKLRDDKSFIDVNSYLSDSVLVLRDIFKESNYYHLVRNPFDCCRSILIRRDDKRMHKLPKKESEIEAWLKMDKLEQICSNWKQTTEDLLKTDAILIRFEELINSYNYCSEKLFLPLGMNISPEAYENQKKMKVNKTKSQLYRFLYAKWKGKNYIPGNANYKLNVKEKERVLAICGETMKKVGY